MRGINIRGWHRLTLTGAERPTRSEKEPAIKSTCSSSKEEEHTWHHFVRPDLPVAPWTEFLDGYVPAEGTRDAL